MDITKRCGICNAVSSPALVNETSRFTGKPFRPDPSDHLHFLCDNCAATYYDMRKDYQKQDLEEGEVAYLDEDELIDDPVTIETILYSNDEGYQNEE